MLDSGLHALFETRPVAVGRPPTRRHRALVVLILILLLLPLLTLASGHLRIPGTTSNGAGVGWPAAPGALTVTP